MKFKSSYLYIFLTLIFSSIFIYFVTRAFQGNFIFPNEVSIGFLSLKFYGLILLGSILVSAFVFEKLLKEYPGKLKHLQKFDIYEALVWVVIPGIIFARIIYYLSFINDYYQGSFAEIYKIWEGGMSIFGAIIGGILGMVLYLKRSKIKLFPIIDLVFISVPLGHAIGRWANFVNQEIYGPPTNLPWKMYVSLEHRKGIPLEYQQYSFFHPLFLYEFILNLILFGLLYFLYKKKKDRPAGFFVALYLIGYGLIRFVMEFPRFDPADIFGLSIAQIISLIMIIGGILYFVFKFKSLEGSTSQKLSRS